MSSTPDTAPSVQSPMSDVPDVPTTPPERPIRDTLRFALLAILIVVPIRLFVAQPFIVSGASMDDTFHNGQYLIVDQVTYRFDAPVRGDVVIFRYPRNPSQYFIKRIIGLPGETVTIKDGMVAITSSDQIEPLILQEPYIDPQTTSVPSVTTLGDTEYFVMGDNRDQSSDSRIWGPLDEEYLVGRAWLRLFPPSTAGHLPGHVDLTSTSQAVTDSDVTS